MDFLTKSFAWTIRFGLKILCYTARKITRNLKKAENCWISGLSSLKKDGVIDGAIDGVIDKGRDHFHFTGSIVERRTAFVICDEVDQSSPRSSFHNLANYDSHFFIKNLGSGGEINCIPNKEEKYISFGKEIEVGSSTSKEGKDVIRIKHKIRFIDSFKFECPHPLMVSSRI